MKLDLGVTGAAIVVVSSFLPWVDAKWLTTGCDAPGLLGTAGIVGWLLGAGLLVASLVTARGKGRLWRDQLVLPALVATLVGGVLVLSAAPSGCGGGGLWG